MAGTSVSFARRWQDEETVAEVGFDCSILNDNIASLLPLASSSSVYIFSPSLIHELFILWPNPC